MIILLQIRGPQLTRVTLKESEIPSDVVYRLGDHLVTEPSKMTPAVVGEKVIEPALALVEYRRRKALIFVFEVRSISSFLGKWRLLH